MKPRNKVLVISNMYPDKRFPAYGTFVKRFCEQLEYLKIEYNMCVMRKAASKPEKVCRYILFYGSAFVKCISGKYDTIYVHYASHSTPAVIFARKFKKFRLIVNVHGSDVAPESEKQEKMQKYTNKSLELADTVVVPSEYFKDYTIKKYKLPDTKVKIYPSAGIDTNFFRPYRSEEEYSGIVEKYKLTPGRRYIGCVGRMTEGKGWKTFARSLKSIINQHSDVEIVMVGSGKDEADVNTLISEYGIEDYIKHFPLIDQAELAELYRVLDLFVFPTERESESLGLVALEAMASGTVVLASDFAAPSYYINDGINGFKFKVGDCENLRMKADIILNLSEAHRKKIVSETLKTAHEYDSDVILYSLERIING